MTQGDEGMTRLANQAFAFIGELISRGGDGV